MSQRVAHIITRCVAGAGGVAVRGAVSLPRDLYSSTLVVGSGDVLLDAARAHGVDVVVMPELVSPISPALDARALRSLDRFLRSESFDVVHTHSAKAGVLGRVAASRAGVPRSCTPSTASPCTTSSPPPYGRRTSAPSAGSARITDTVPRRRHRRRGRGPPARVVRPEQLVTIGPAVERPGHRVAGPRARARDAARAARGRDGGRHRGADGLPEGAGGHVVDAVPPCGTSGASGCGSVAGPCSSETAAARGAGLEHRMRFVGGQPRGRAPTCCPPSTCSR